jgi:hypothetical protein
MSEVATITRTSQGLVDALFNTIDRLNNREIDAEQARAISHTAKSIVSVASLELEYRKFATGEGSGQKLVSLVLDVKADKSK